MLKAVQAYQAYIEFSPVPMVVIDRRTLRYLAINRAALDLYGYSRKEMMALSIKDVRPRGEIPRLLKRLRAIKPGTRSQGIWTHLRRDGQPIEVEVYTRPLSIGSGMAHLATLIDVTQRQRARAELESSREMLDVVLANVPDFVTRIDGRGKILYINKVAKDIDRSRVLGSDSVAYAHPADRPRLRKTLRRVLRTGKPVFLETRRLGPQGQMLRYRNWFSRIVEKDAAASVLAVSTDVTDVRAAEEELKESRESYRLLFDGNPNPMVVSDRATCRYLAVNEAAIRRYGYSREEWLKMTIYDIRPPDEAVRLRRLHIGEGLASQGVWKHRRKDGALIDVDVTTSSIRFQGHPAILGMLRDVTSERRAQEDLRRSREHYRSLFVGHPLPMWVGDYASLKILDVNEAAIKTFGFSRAEFIGKSILELRSEKDRTALKKRIHGGKAGAGMTYQGPTVYRRKDRSCFDAEVYVSELEFEGRRAFVTSVLDVSEDLKAKEVQERFAGLFNSARDGLTFAALDGTLLEINDALCRMLGYSRSELVDRKKFLSLAAPEYHPMSRAAAEEVLRTGEPVEFEKEYIRKDGTRLPAVVTVFRIKGPTGAPAGFAAIVRDVTERKRLEKEILEIGAREQSRIGRDLHDSLGQHLTGISFLAKSLKAQLAGNGAAQARLAERIARAAQDAVEQVKALAAGLLPADLLPNGLPAALRAMALQAERTFGINCTVTCPKRWAGMEEASLLHFYRIAQEAVANAAKHSGARKVRIALRESDGNVILEVSDDGKGIRRGNGKGLGLKIMAHRARMLGGSFGVRRGPKGGTIVTCTCPSSRALL